MVFMLHLIRFMATGLIYMFTAFEEQEVCTYSKSHFFIVLKVTFFSASYVFVCLPKLSSVTSLVRIISLPQESSLA